MIFAAGRMTATARADIGTRFEATLSVGLGLLTDVVSSDDLDWKFALCPRSGHPTGIVGGVYGQEEQREDVTHCVSCTQMLLALM